MSIGRQYETDKSMIRMATRLSGTVLVEVLERPAFWVNLAVHLTVWLMFRHGYASKLTTVWDLDWNDVKVVVAITTFFEVFYISHCYVRYNTLYAVVRDLLADIALISLTLRVRVRDQSPEHAWLACRYIMAAFLSYVHLLNPHASPWSDSLACGACSDSSSCDEQVQEPLTGLSPRGKPGTLRLARGRNGSRPEQQWPVSRLLTPDEAAVLQAYDEAQSRIILFSWGLEAVDRGMTKCKAPPNARQATLTSVLELQGNLEHLHDMIRLPVPFQYFHLLNVMVCVSLLGIAYRLGASLDLAAPIMFLAYEFTFLGLMELASDLSNPFGDDEVDFPLGLWVAGTISRVSAIMESKYKDNNDAAWAPLLEAQGRLGLCVAASGAR